MAQRPAFMVPTSAAGRVVVFGSMAGSLLACTFPFVGLLAGLGFFCKPAEGTVEIRDAGQPTRVEMIACPRHQPSGVWVRITGEIGGEGEFWVGDPTRRERISGPVDVERQHDCFRSCVFEYVPVDARGGHLTVSYWLR